MRTSRPAARVSITILAAALFAIVLDLPTRALSAPGDSKASAPSGKITVVGLDDSYKWAVVGTKEMWVDLNLDADDIDYFVGSGNLGGNLVDSNKWNGGATGYCENPVNTFSARWYATNTGLTAR